MTDFINPLLGGALIGLGSILAMAASGKIPGISGILARTIRPAKGDFAWRAVFLIGLVAGAGLAIALKLGWQGYSIPAQRGIPVLAIAGFIVGFGTRMGGGCTSGHGVCGIGSGARDAIVYTLVFMATAIATVFAWNLFVKGGAA